MPLFYFDASALAKRSKREDGTDVVDLVFSRGHGGRLVTSFLAAVELAGAANRLRKSKVFTDRAASEFIARFGDDMTSLLEVFPISEAIVALAIGIAERHGLRAADSIHLATMIEIQRASVTAET